MITKLLLTALFVFLNGFFVAAEFALVKTRVSRIQALAAKGNSRAIRLRDILNQLDLYLSACQLGITIASLVLGYLAEPAFATLLERGAVRLGIAAPDNEVLHIIAFGLALSIVTILHMVLGEQAPKIWAIQTAEAAALRLSLPLKLFTIVFRPFIVVVNTMSNALLRLLGMGGRGGHAEEGHDVRELKAIIGAAASAGNISARQRRFAENIIDLVDLQVRHIMLPRAEVAFLELETPRDENLERIRTLGHSRWPLVERDLDSVIGIVLARDVLDHVLARPGFTFEEIARKSVFVPDTQPLSRFILECQQTGHQAAMVLDEHGTVVGMVFLEDALEEIVGPLHDERDEPETSHSDADTGVIELSGATDLPEARQRLGVELDALHDTIGGVIVAQLGRLPRKGDRVSLGAYDVEVVKIGRRRSIELLRFTEHEPELESER